MAVRKILRKGNEPEPIIRSFRYKNLITASSLWTKVPAEQKKNHKQLTVSVFFRPLGVMHLIRVEAEVSDLGMRQDVR